ncbi:MAG: MATE family efflux transporter [Lachnospiraceae bacterium]|nr:MATE family efflux transporter [Lachnospiraceae bacterium]
MKKEKTDLGTDSVGKLLFKLAVPAILAQLVNMLYNIVDRIYIGHIKDTGAIALTGIGLCLPMILLVMAFSALMGMGGAPKAAIYMGKGDLESARKTLGCCVVMLTGMAVLLTIVFLAFGKDLLYLFGASDNTISYAWGYLRIYVCGSIFVMISLGLNSFITTQGFSLIGMGTILIGAAANIILDPIFIFGFQMGVSGAALATILSQGISAVWVLRFLRGEKTQLRIEKKYLQMDREYVLPVLALGVSPFVMQSTESLINISYNTSLYKYGGDLAVSAITILSSVMQMIFLPLSGLGQGAQPIISYNYGAGKNDRVKKAFRLLFGISMGFAAAIWAVIMMLPGIFVHIFNSSSQELYDMAVWAMRIFMAGAFAMGGQMACQQTFLALGQAKASLFFACFRKLILMIPLIFLLPLFLADKLMAVFLAEAVSDLLAAAVTVITFLILFPRILKKER